MSTLRSTLAFLLFALMRGLGLGYSLIRTAGSTIHPIFSWSYLPLTLR